MTYLFLWHRRGTYKTLRYTTSEHWTSFTFTQFIIIFFICKAEALCFTYLICLDQKYLNIEEINSKWSHIIFYIMGSCCNMPGFLFSVYTVGKLEELTLRRSTLFSSWFCWGGLLILRLSRSAWKFCSNQPYTKLTSNYCRLELQHRHVFIDVRACENKNSDLYLVTSSTKEWG